MSSNPLILNSSTSSSTCITQTPPKEPISDKISNKISKFFTQSLQPQLNAITSQMTDLSGQIDRLNQRCEGLETQMKKLSGRVDSIPSHELSQEDKYYFEDAQKCFLRNEYNSAISKLTTMKTQTLKSKELLAKTYLERTRNFINENELLIQGYWHCSDWDDKKNNANKAIKDLELCILCSTDNDLKAEAHLFRGLLHKKMDQNDLAEKEFESVIDLLPRNKEFFNKADMTYLSLIWLDQNKKEQHMKRTGEIRQNYYYTH